MKGKFLTVACWVWTVLICFLVILPIFTPSVSQIRSQQMTEELLRANISKFKAQSLDSAYNLMIDLIKMEDDRFKHLDTKANSYLGMLGIGLTVLLTGGGFLVERMKNGIPKTVRGHLTFFYAVSFLLFSISFLTAVSSTAVPGKLPNLWGWFLPPVIHVSVNAEILVRADFGELKTADYKKVVLEHLITST